MNADTNSGLKLSDGIFGTDSYLFSGGALIGQSGESWRAACISAVSLRVSSGFCAARS